MKFISKIAVLLIAFNSWTMIMPQKATAQVSINFQVFYDDLSPYGSWVLNTHYGYVWVPDVSVGFIPYNTNGYWVFTNVGWTWVSNYSWGWAPFHYGRWYYDYIYGWIWVPDYEWGPAWVIWRRCEGYYGWAPIGPGISINIAYGGSYNLPHNQWTLVRDRDLGRTNINYINTSNNSRILKNSTVINNIRIDNTNHVKYGMGPNRNEVQKRSGNTITTYALRERSKPGHNLSNRELNIYKPRVEKQNASGRKPIPYKVLSMEDAKSRKQSNTKTNPSQQKRYEQPAQQPQQKKNNQPTQQQRYDQPAQQPQQKKNNQPTQQQRYDQPAQQPQQKKNNQPTQQQRYDQPSQQPQQKKNNQHTQYQPRYDQPIQRPQQKRNDQHTQYQPRYDQPTQQPQQMSHEQHTQQQGHGQDARQRSVPEQHSQKNH